MCALSLKAPFVILTCLICLDRACTIEGIVLANAAANSYAERDKFNLLGKGACSYYGGRNVLWKQGFVKQLDTISRLPFDIECSYNLLNVVLV
jgi:hypothetical protein